MKLTGLSVLSETAVIVNSVGCVGVLLNLGEKYALAYCVHCARLDEENIALLDLDSVAYAHHLVALSGFFEFFNRNIAVESEDKLCVGLTIKNVPCFGLAVFAFNAHCIFVIGMNLNRKISLCVNEFIFFPLCRICSCRRGKPPARSYPDTFR